MQGNNNTTHVEAIEQKELAQIIIKTRNQIKEKTDNRISFAHFKLAENGRPEEELTDDGLIKRYSKTGAN